MKRIIIVIVALVLVLGAVFAQQARYRNGVFTSVQTRAQPAAPADPVGGNVTVATTIRNNRITAVVITASTDTDDYLNIVRGFLIPSIVEANSPDVDVLAGATGTSRAVMEAVRDALNQARR